MINSIAKIVLFLIVNVIGFYAAPVVYVLVTKFELMPHIADENLASADMLFFKIGFSLWLPMALISIGHFLAPKEWQLWLLLAPVYVPTLYVLALVAYFHFI